MKILQLCLRVPDPPSDGGSIAMKSIAESLRAAGATIKVLAFNTKKHFVESSKVSHAYRENTSLETVYLDATVKMIPVIFNLFSRSSYNIERFDSPEFAKKLIQVLTGESFDIVQLESLYLAPYVDVIRKHSKAKIVLRSHNVEYCIWSHLADRQENFFKKKYLSFLTKRLKAYEISMLNRYDAILPITLEDKIIMVKDGCVKPFHITPLGLETGKYKLEQNGPNAFSVFHLGSMDWFPNLDGIDWFLSKVLPGLMKRDPGVVVYLAGKNMPERLKQMSSQNLIVEDAISDAIAYMSDKPVMLVPLFSGGGMRVKIIEGMAMGKTIISTNNGAEGIACEHLKNIIIANTPGEFIDWILACKNDPGLCKKIGTEARLLATSLYENKVIGAGLYNFYEKELLI